MLNQNIVKEHAWLEPSTFRYEAQSPSTGPLFLLLNTRSSLILNLRLNNFKSKRS